MRQRIVEVSELKPRPRENANTLRQRARLGASLGERSVAKQLARLERRPHRSKEA